MGNVHEFRKLLEPPTKQEKNNKGRRTYVICGQCNKSEHSKEHYYWNIDNMNNKFKDKKEVAVNGVLVQPADRGIKSNNKRGDKKTNKSSSFIYRCFICNSIEHKIYDYTYKDIV
jgi:hypothetical protein